MIRAFMILTFIPIISIIGCATAAQQRAAQLRRDIPVVIAKSKSCSDAVDDKPNYLQVGYRTASKNLRTPTLAQLTDDGLATDEETALIVDRHNDMAHCREQLIKELMNVESGVIPIMTTYWQMGDLVLADLITRKITFGEANKRRSALVNEQVAKLTEYGNQLDRNLAAAHNAEIQNRDAAFSALLQWSQQQQMLMQNQQMLNAINKPVTTNCYRIGNSVQCTSY
jgi:hypothetical protein